MLKRFLISLVIATFVLYFGGWRIVTSDSDTAGKVSRAWENRDYNQGTKITENFIANAELNVYVYHRGEGDFFGIMNIYEKNYGDGSVILALLVIAIPFGVFII